MNITTITVFRISAHVEINAFLQLINDIRTHDIYEQKDKKRCSSKEVIKVNVEKFYITNEKKCERDCEQETR